MLSLYPYVELIQLSSESLLVGLLATLRHHIVGSLQMENTLE